MVVTSEALLLLLLLMVCNNKGCKLSCTVSEILPHSQCVAYRYVIDRLPDHASFRSS